MMGGVQLSLLVVIVAVNFQNVFSEKCVHCIHLNFTPSPPKGFPNIYHNAHCKKYNSRILAANTHDCPDDGKDYVCGAITGNYTFDVPSVGITTVDTILRRCVVQPKGVSVSKGGKMTCLKGNTLDKATNDIQLVGATEEFGDMTKFDGQVCYCNGRNCNTASTIEPVAFLVSILLATIATVLVMY